MNKITVLIVDDEKLVIEDLISIVDWEACGFEIVATVRNGKQALAKFKELCPQVVITDIKMPFMDGLELAQEIRKLNMQTKIILLTAYSDFSYAKQAIEHGITDYLLKNEISEHTIAVKLQNLKSRIEAENRTSGLVMQKLILDLFNTDKDHIDETMYDQSIKKMLSVPGFYFIVEEDIPLPIVTNFQDRNDPHSEYEIISHCVRFRLSGFNVEYAGILRNKQVLLSIQPVENSSQNTAYAVLKNDAAALIQELSAHFKTSFTAYVLYNRISLLELRKLYFTCNKRLNAKYILGSGSVYELQDPELDWVKKEIAVDEAQLLNILDKLDNDALAAYIEEIYHQVMPPEMNFYGLLSVSQTLYACLKRSVEELPPTADRPDISYSTNSVFWLDAKSIKSWMKLKFESLILEKRKQLENKYSREVLKAIEYIKKNYDDKELKIDYIASYVGLSSARLSVIFKKETGKTINEFITGIRIKKSKELLETGEYKVYEIAAMVGYGSSQYFSQIFYLETGLSPNNYRRGSTK